MCSSDLVEIFFHNRILRARLGKAIEQANWPEVEQVLAEWRELEEPGKVDRA